MYIYKKILAVITLFGSISSFAHIENDTSSNKICGIDKISLSKIGYAVSGTKIVEVMSDFRSEGADVVVCNYEEVVAVVATFKNNVSEVLIFNK